MPCYVTGDSVRLYSAFAGLAEDGRIKVLFNKLAKRKEMKMKIFEECYTLSNGAKIPKMGLGTWFIPDETHSLSSAMGRSKPERKQIQRGQPSGMESTGGGIQRGQD